MSATNSTTHYNLPSFLGSDKPAWLVDWNGAMATIDSAIYEAKQSGDSAGASASAVASDLATLSGTVSTQGSTISALSETLTTAVGNINTINSLIGNGTPTTTDHTIIGAINEINANVTDSSTPGTLANEVADLKANLTTDTTSKTVNDLTDVSSSISFTQFELYKKNGFTVLSFVITASANVSWDTIFKLPEGYRPDNSIWLCTGSDNSNSKLCGIYNNGNVQVSIPSGDRIFGTCIY